MSWDTTMAQFVRVIINDLDSPYDYEDSRLKTVIIHAANLVYNDIDFSVTYTIDTTAETLSPDPTVTATRDDDFTNLIVLKACCIIDQGKFRAAILQSGLKAKAGPAVLETMGYNKGFKELIEVGPCSAYQVARDDKVFGNGNICRAILGPFVGNNFDPYSLDGYGGDPRNDQYS